jgi:tape measure domain-containing protein
MGTLGSASVKLNLDRSQFDSDLTKLQATDAGQVAYRIKLDTKDFERQIKGLSKLVTSVFIPLEIDTKTFDQQIKKLSTSIDPIKVDLAPNVADFQEKLRRLAKISPIVVDIKIDEAKVRQQFEQVGKYAAEGFTQGFSGVEGAGKSAIDSMVKSVNKQLGIQSPSKVFREIGKYAIAGLMQGLDSVDTRAIVNKITSEFRAIDISTEVRLIADTKGLQRQITGGLVASVNVEVSGNSTSKLSDSIADAVAHAVKKTSSKGLFGGILDMVAAPFKLASGALLSVVTLPFKALGAGLGHTFEGLFLGAGLPLGESLGAGIAKGVNKALKGKFNANLSQIGINLTDLSKADWNLAKAIDALFIEGNPIGKARKAVKDLQDVFADLKVLVAPGTIEKVVDFGKLSSAGPREFKKQYVAAAKKAKEQGRELTPEQFTEELKPKAEFKAVGTAIKLVSAPIGFKNKVMSFEAQRQIESRSQKIKVPEISEPTVTLVTGGFQKQRGRGAYEIAELAKTVLPGSHVIPIPNTYTDRKATDTKSELLNFIKSLGMDVPPGLLDTLQNTEKLVGTGAKGYSPDAIRIAAYARAVQRKYPDKPVNAVTFSGGTYPLEQAIQFDSDAGGKAKGIGLGAGLYGLTGRHNPNYRAMIGEQDPLGFPFQLLKPTKNTTIIPNFADTTSMDVHNPKRYFANPSVQGAMSEMFSGFVPPQGSVKAQEDIFSLTNRKVATNKHTARLNKFIADPTSVQSKKVDESFGELADFLTKNKSSFGTAPNSSIPIGENPRLRTIPQLMASGDSLALDAQKFYDGAKKVLSKASVILAKPLGISEAQLKGYDPEQQLKVIRAISKVKSEAPGLNRTVARLEGTPDNADYSFYTRDSSVAKKRTEDFKGLISYLRSQVLTDLPADIDKLAQEYLKYLEELQGAIVKLVTNGEAIAPEILAQKDKLNLLSFDPIETSASEQTSTTDQKASNLPAVKDLQRPPIALPATGIDLAPKPQPLIESGAGPTLQSESNAKKIEEGFKKYSETFKNQVQASQEIGDFTEVNKQIQDFIKYAARAKKELEEIRQLVITNGEIEKSDSQNPASRAKKTITNQTKKIQQELGKSGNSFDLVSSVDRELALLDKEGTSIGTNLSKGIALGVQQSAPLAIESAELMALKIIETTKETFGIQSPSKKFKQIGQHIGEGFEIGIKSSMQEANEELLRLVDSSVKAAEKLSLSTPPPPPGFNSPIGKPSALPTPPPPPGFYSPITKPKSVPPDAPPLPSPAANSASASDGKDPNRGIAAFFSGLKIGKDGRDTGAGAIANIFKNIKNQAEESFPILKNFSGLLSSLFKGFLAFQGGMILQSVLSKLSVDAFKAYVELDRLKTALNFASGGSAGGAQNLAFVRKTVDDLGVPLKESAQGFTQLAAAARGSALEGRETRELFQGISEASTVLGLSAEDTQGAISALSQMISKNRIGADDLRQQLGDRLPGAMSIFARAAGMSEAELNKLMESGQAISQDILPKLSRQFHSEFGEAAKTAGNNAQSSIFKVQNAFLSLQQGIGEGVAPSAMAGLNALSDVLEQVAKVGKEIAIIIAAVSAALLVNLGKALWTIIGQLILTKAAGATLGGAFSQLASTINNSFSAQITVGIFALLEAINLVNSAVNTELVQSFNKAGEAAKRAAEESRKRFGDPGKEPEKDTGKPGESSIKPVASSGFGRFYDDYLAPVYNADIGPFRGGDVFSGNKETFGSYEQGQMQAGIADLVGEAGNLAIDTRKAIKQLQTRTGDIGRLPAVNTELTQAEQQRQILQAQTKRDYTDKGLAIPAQAKQDLDNQNIKIQQLNDKRAEIAKPYNLQITDLDRQINTIKAKREEIKSPDAIATAGGTEAASRMDDQLKSSYELLKGLKAQAESALAALRINPIQAFTNALRQLNLTLAEGQEKNKESLAKNKLANAREAIAGFSTDKLASKKLTFKNANDEYIAAQIDEANSATAVKTYDEAASKPDFQSTLKRLGLTPDSSAAKIDDILKNTSDESDKNILEQLKAGRESKVKFTEAQSATADTKTRRNQVIQDTSLFLLDDSAADSRSKIQKDENDKISFLKGAQAAKLISEEMANEKISRVQLNSSQLQKKSLVDQLTALRAYHEQGKVSAEEFTKRQRDLSTDLTATERQEAENRLAVQQTLLARRLKDIEFANKKAESAIALSSTNATTKAKEKLLGSGLTPQAQDQFGLDKNSIDQKAAADNIALVKTKIAINEQEYKAGRRSAREFAEQQMALNQELAQSNQQLIDLKITAEEKHRETFEHNIQRIMQFEENRFKKQTSQLDESKAKLDLYNQSLERSNRLEQSRNNLSKALSNAALAPLENKKADADDAEALVQKLKDPSIKPQAKAAIKAKLREMGYGPKTGVTVTPATVKKSTGGDSAEDYELQIKEKKEDIEQNIASIKELSMKAEQEFQRKSLENDLKRQKIAAQTALYEAQSAQYAAQKAKNDAEGALKIAIAKKDPAAIETAQTNLDIANKQIDLSNQRVDSAQANVNDQPEIAANATLEQKVTQGTEAQNLQAGESRRRRGAAIDLVETSEKAGRPISLSEAEKNRSPELALPTRIDINQMPKLELKPGENLFDAYQRQREGMKLPTPGAQLPSNKVDIPPMDKTAAALNSASIQPRDSSSGNQFVEALKMANQGIEQRLDALSSAIMMLANTPRSLSISSPNPIDDAADFMNRISRGQVMAAGA